MDIQRFTQDAQQEIQELQNQLHAEFQQRSIPILEQVGQEKGLHFIFNGPDSGLVWADRPRHLLDVIKKLDADAEGQAAAIAAAADGSGVQSASVRSRRGGSAEQAASRLSRCPELKL